MDDLGRDKKTRSAYTVQKPVMKKRLFLTCAVIIGLSACSSRQDQDGLMTGNSASAGTALAPVTAPGKKPDRPVVKLPEKSVPVPSVSPSYNDVPLAPRIPGATVNRVAVPDKVVALTFDDGPHGTLTPKVLDILRNNNVKGTFFMQGCNVTAHPQVVRRMVNEGHEVGNHTWNHAYLSKVSREKAEDQLQRTNEAIRNACGVIPVVMRPPGGYTNAGVASWARQRFGFTTIMWDVDTNDWRKPGSAVVAARAVNGAKPGSIILVHDIHASTVAAVDAFVKGLKNRGYELVTVSELLRRGRAASRQASPVQPLSPAVPAAPVSPVTPGMETVPNPVPASPASVPVETMAGM